MPKVYCYLNQKTVDQLEQIKLDEAYESTSQAMKEIVDLGIKVYLHNKENLALSESDKKRLEKEEELKQQHTMYLLRLLSLNADILRCVYDENKFTNPSNMIEEHIAKTKQKVDHFIEGFVNN